MRAVILKGKYKGFICEVSQWCNNWITLDPRDSKRLSEQQQIDIMRKPFSPTSLAFTYAGIQEIKNNPCGIMFKLFEICMTKKHFIGKSGAIYNWTFKKRKQII